MRSRATPHSRCGVMLTKLFYISQPAQAAWKSSPCYCGLVPTQISSVVVARRCIVLPTNARPKQAPTSYLRWYKQARASTRVAAQHKQQHFMRQRAEDAWRSHAPCSIQVRPSTRATLKVTRLYNGQSIAERTQCHDSYGSMAALASANLDNLRSIVAVAPFIRFSSRDVQVQLRFFAN